MQSLGNSDDLTLSWQRLNATHVAFAMIGFAVLMQVELVFSKSINWDEFLHFSQIHRHLQDRPVQWLQVPHVWLFSWVPTLSGDNISHIQIVRLLILPFELVTIGAITASARRFVRREEAIFCALIYVTGGYVFLHAFALRADMIAASLLTTALWIGICRPLRVLEIITLVGLVVLAFVCTIKSVLYAPAFLGVALFRIEKTSHRWMLAGVVAAVLITGTLLLWNAHSLSQDGVSGVLRDIAVLGRNSIDRMFSAGLFPQPRWLQGQILRAPLLFLAVVLAFVSIITKREGEPKERILLLSLLLPLCTVAFYRNTFPYHFVFILPPAMIAIAPTVSLLLRRYGLVPLSLLLLAIAMLLSLSQDRSVLARQRTVQAGVHEIFPTPVTYIDDCGMLGNFPRAINHFASGWALANYRHTRLPTYSMAMQAEPVPLLLANNDLLTNQFFDLGIRDLLLPEDEQAIRENYIQHWGLVFVAGKGIAAGNEEHIFDIAVPGTYTVEGGQIVIDGNSYSAGSVTELSRGPHRASGNRPTRVMLRWGNHLHRPQYLWPDGPLFTEF